MAYLCSLSLVSQYLFVLRLQRVTVSKLVYEIDISSNSIGILYVNCTLQNNMMTAIRYIRFIQ